MSSYTIIDADTHVTEAPDLWTSRAPARMRARVPHSADARRLLPITSIPFWDVEAAVKEVRRCAAMGHKRILFTGEPQYFGKPLLGDPHWNPLWEVAVDLDQPCGHVARADMETDRADEANRAAAIARRVNGATT